VQFIGIRQLSLVCIVECRRAHTFREALQIDANWKFFRQIPDAIVVKDDKHLLR
jgi:hypothetical protein